MKVKLPDICRIQYGYAFDSAGFTEDEMYIPLVRIRDVKRGYSETFYNGDYPEEFIIHSGDLLVGMDGEFNIARWQSRDALLNQRVCKMTAKEGTNEEYLRFALSKALKTIENRTAFVTVKHLSAKELNKLEIDVPQLVEQKKVADTLAKIEAVISMRQEELKTLDELIKARFVEMFGDPETNPKGWKKEALKDHAIVIVGYPFPSEGYTAEGIDIVGGYNLMQGYIQWDESKHWPNADGYDQYLLQANDIVMAMDRPWVNGGFKIARVDANHLPALLIQRTACIRGVDIEQEFLHSLLDTQRFAEHCNITGSLVPHISNKDINNFQVIVPPIEEQKRYTSFVAQVDRSKAAVQKSLDETQMLFDSLMQEYFG